MSFDTFAEHAHSLAAAAIEGGALAGAFLTGRAPASRRAPLPIPEPATRPRGVYLSRDHRPGVVVVLVYSRRGDLMVKSEVAVAHYHSDTFDAFVRWLDAEDPEPRADAPTLRLA